MAHPTGVWRTSSPRQHATTRTRTDHDYIGGFAVTSGHGLDELVKKFKADHDDYNAIMAEALADRLAEAFAEFLHKRVRQEWGYGRDEKLSTKSSLKRNIAVFGRRPVIPHARITRRSGFFGTCSMWSATPA